ncbi:MAG: DUF1501 domain-containing protein [Pseudomonadota bacterium]
MVLNNMTLDRRAFLQKVGAVGFGASLTSTLAPMAARAADVSGYKAIVCLFLKGGMDGHDTLLPYDTGSYNRYAEIRQGFMSADSNLEGGPLRARNALLELNPANASMFGSRAYALPRTLSGVHSLFERGKASIVGNVGPLLTPLNATQFKERKDLRPRKLFSHNDQQSTWMALGTEGQRIGWGGRFADAALASNANSQPAFTAMSFAGNEVFLSGESVFQYRVGRNGAPGFEYLNNRQWHGGGRQDPVVETLLQEHFSKSSDVPSNLFAQDVVTTARRAFTSNRDYSEALDQAPEFEDLFPDSGLGGQLRAAARTIASRGSLGVNRQVFIVTKGGFDTHNRQVTSMAGLHNDIDASVSAFYSAMEQLGVEDDVLLFTASDFGRTFTLNNGSGTDHGWGAHHLVVGGSIDGGKIFGTMPPYDLDHEFDTGRGRMIPSTSVEQFAAPIGRWFGLNEDEVRSALPNLTNFEGGPAFV